MTFYVTSRVLLFSLYPSSFPLFYFSVLLCCSYLRLPHLPHNHRRIQLTHLSLNRIKYADPTGRPRLWECAERTTKPSDADVDAVGVVALVRDSVSSPETTEGEKSGGGDHNDDGSTLPLISSHTVAYTKQHRRLTQLIIPNSPSKPQPVHNTHPPVPPPSLSPRDRAARRPSRPLGITTAMRDPRVARRDGLRRFREEGGRGGRAEAVE